MIQTASDNSFKTSSLYLRAAPLNFWIVVYFLAYDEYPPDLA